MIGSNFNNSANSDILDKVNNFQKTLENTAETPSETQKETEIIKASIERLDATSEAISEFFKLIKLQNEAEDLEKKKKKPIPLEVLLEINDEIQRRKLKGISTPYYKDRAFVDLIMRVYDVDITG